MATMNISLPEPMKRWVEGQADEGRYANSSDYVRDLIRQDQVRQEKIAHMQKLVDEARAEPAIEAARGGTFAQCRIRSPPALRRTCDGSGLMERITSASLMPTPTRMGLREPFTCWPTIPASPG